MFDCAWCINLDRRPERWKAFSERFPRDWPWSVPVRWGAVDGASEAVPEWYHGGPGAWGCQQTHLAIWQWQVNQGMDSVLVLEDDAIFGHNAITVIEETMQLVPDDWDQVYFGGQHLDTSERPPECVIQDKLIRCRNVNRTHAYAIRLKFAAECIEAVDRQPATPDGRIHHVDYRIAELHDSHQVYAPWRFCVGQVGGASDVRSTRGRPAHVIEHWWNQFPIVEPAGVR